MFDDEPAWQAAIDAEPDNYTLRLIFADWLQDRDDERTAGYRALGLNQWRACLCVMKPSGDFFHIFGTKKNSLDRGEDWPYYPCLIDHEWYGLLFGEIEPPVWWRYWDTRRAAEDAIAKLFAKLPTAHRAELLKQSVEVDTLV